jgi:RNA polymerase sigma-70 factor (ECF subfamily)
MVALSSGDVASVEAELMPTAITINDTAGDYRAALRVVVGSSRVARFYLGLMKKVPPTRFSVRTLNGLPALVADLDRPPPGIAPRLVFRCDLGEGDRIAEVHGVAARAKLHAITA